MPNLMTSHLKHILVPALNHQGDLSVQIFKKTGILTCGFKGHMPLQTTDLQAVLEPGRQHAISTRREKRMMI